MSAGRIVVARVAVLRSLDLGLNWGLGRRPPQQDRGQDRDERRRRWAFDHRFPSPFGSFRPGRVYYDIVCEAPS